MIGLALVMALAGVRQADSALPAGVSTADGRCDYPAQLPPPGPGETRVLCDAVVISPGRRDGDLFIQFAEKRGTSIVGFAGHQDGERLAIERVYLRPGEATAATGGHCKLFGQGETLSGVSCVVKLGPRTLVANFRAFVP